jgi:hypothetical protein
MDIWTILIITAWIIIAAICLDWSLVKGDKDEW